MARAVALRPLVFQHVPKTAGVSLRSVISSNFHARETLHVADTHWKDGRLAARAARRYRFIHGHLHYEFVSGILGSTDVITFLRDPVERVLSLYFFLRNQKITPDMTGGARLAIEQAQKLPVEEFVGHTDPLIGAMISNYQVQMFLTAAQINGPARGWVANALANLEPYRFVGIADGELMSKCVGALTTMFGWVPSGDAPRVNHISRPAASVELEVARRVIAERNQHDLDFYNRVRAQLPAALDLRGAKLTRARAMARTQQRRYQTGLASPVTMDQPLRGWGWYERDHRAKEYLRGAAQLRVGLELRLPAKSPLLLVLTMRSVHPRLAIADTVIESGGERLPSAAFVKNERTALAVLVKRKNIDRNGILTMVINCKEAESGAIAAAAVPNRRFVAFMLESIEVTSGAGLGATPLLEQLLIQRPHVVAVAKELAAERAGRRAEQLEVAAATAALTERAERSETYSTSLAGELQKLQSEYRTLTAARATEQTNATRYAAELQDSVQRSHTYAASLVEQLARLEAEHRAVVAAREAERTAAEKLQAARATEQANASRYAAELQDSVQRSQTYAASLAEELARLQAEHRAVVAAREAERTEYRTLTAARATEQTNATRYAAELQDSVQRSQTYAASLAEELARQQGENRALVSARQTEQADAARQVAELRESVSRSETYTASLLEELARLKAAHRAVVSAREIERAAAETHQAALTDRAERSETYCASLQAELAKLSKEVEVSQAYNASLQAELTNVRNENRALNEQEGMAVEPPPSVPAAQREGAVKEDA